MFCFPLPSFSFTDFISSSSNGAIWNKSEERRKLGAVQFVFVNLTMNFPLEFFRLCGSYLFRNWCDFFFFYFISSFFASASFRLMFNECQVMHSFPLKVLFFKTKFWFKIKCIDASVSLKLIFLIWNKYPGLKIYK